MTIQIKAIEQYFHVVLFIMLYKLVVTFNSVDETLVCDNSNAIDYFFHVVLFVFQYYEKLNLGIFLNFQVGCSRSIEKL